MNLDMNFIALDITLLVLFCIFVGIFLYVKRHNLQREGLMYLYRTKLGLILIEKTSKKYAKILRPLQYIVIISGFILMIVMFWLLIQTLFTYLDQPADSPISRVPAVFPLIPYFPQLFNLDSFFPPFYFIYFIIAIAIVAVSHEFAHGIFARLNKIRILSTGFAFLGPFLGAFVEQDDKQMWKAKKVPQMAILAAGTFANVVMTILFTILLIIFFKLAFIPAGFMFNTYATSVVNIDDINTVNNISIQEFKNLNITSPDLITLSAGNKIYFANPVFLSYAIQNNASRALVYDDAPAVRSGLRGAITDIDGIKITSVYDLQQNLAQHKPGDKININTISSNKTERSYEITLGDNEGKAFLGIGSIPYDRKGFFASFYKLFMKVKDPNTYYTSKIGEFGQFFYDLIWWIVIINILVALFNMFPAGILDGGRFLLLAIWGITGNKRHGEIALKITTWILLAVIAIMMVKWVLVFF